MVVLKELAFQDRLRRFAVDLSHLCDSQTGVAQRFIEMGFKLCPQRAVLLDKKLVMIPPVYFVSIIPSIHVGYGHKMNSWQSLRCSLLQKRMTSLPHTPVTRVHRTYAALQSHNLRHPGARDRTG